MSLGFLWFPFHSGYLASVSSLGISFSSVATKVFACVDFWILWIAHTALFWVRDRLGECRQNDAICELEKARWKEYEINVEDLWEFNALMVIMLYGYNWHCYQRLREFFEASGSLTRHLDRVSLTLRIYIDDVEDRWNVIRYLLASLRTSKFGIQAQRTAISNDKSPQSQWDQFMRTSIVGDRLLLQHEAEFLQRIDGNKQEVLCSWCVVSMRNLLFSLREKNTATPQDLAVQHEHTLVLAAVTEDTKRVREAVSRIGEHLLFVFPSSALPFLSVGLWANMLLLGHAMLFIQDGNGSYLSMLVYPVIVFFLLGLRESSNMLLSPLSEASCYSAIESWTDNFISDTLLAANNPNEPFRHQLGAVCTPNINQKGHYSSAAAHPETAKPSHAPWTHSLEQSTETTRQLDATLNRLLDVLPSNLNVLSPQHSRGTKPEPTPPDESPLPQHGRDSPSTPLKAAAAPALPALFGDGDAGAAEPRAHQAVDQVGPSAAQAAEGSRGGRVGSSIFKGRAGKRSLLSEAKRPHLIQGHSPGMDSRGVLGSDSLLGRTASPTRRLDRVAPLPPGATDS